MPAWSWSAAHLLVLAAEVALAVTLAIGLAFLGTEEAQLTKQRGQDLSARTEAGYRLQQLHGELEWEGGQVPVEAAVRRLDLPLVPVGTSADRPTLARNP